MLPTSKTSYQYFTSHSVCIWKISIHFNIIHQPVMKPSGVIFTRLEKSNNSKYPKFIKDILMRTAFDSAASLKTLNKSCIENIEKFVHENKELVKDTVYVDEEGNLKNIPFKFMIGHESLLLNIPKDLEVYLSKKNTVEKKRETPAFDDLRSTFKNKLQKYLNKKHINLTFGEDLGEDLAKHFSKKNNRVKCIAQCPFCEARFPCVYDSCWRVSNYFKHIVPCLKKHAPKQALETTGQTFPEISNPIAAPIEISIERAKTDVVAHIQKELS